MKNIDIKINGIENSVNIQRYFLLDNQAYFIYSNEEADSDGNVKIYVTKVGNNNIVSAISDGEEWDKIKKAIVGIINDNKECSKLDVEDLNPLNLVNLEITEARALRLPSAVIQYLSANIPLFEVETIIPVEENNTNIELESFDEQLNKGTEELEQPVVEKDNVDSFEHNDVVNPNDDNESNMEATMQIIMPTKITKQIDEPKKKKNKFNFKNIFGKKDENPIIEEIKQLENKKDEVEVSNIKEEVPVEIEPTITPIQTNIIVDKADLPEPEELSPIVIGDDIRKIDDISDSTMINVDNNNVGIDFFEAAPIFPLEKSSDNEQVMEILTLEEDLKYKKMYDEISEKNAELENKIFEMQKAIEIYEAKIQEIKNIAK